MKEKRLVRSTNDRMLFGVAGGLANYLNIDPVLVRLAFVLLTLAHGWGLIIYVILAIIMREAETVPAGKANGFDDEEIVIN